MILAPFHFSENFSNLALLRPPPIFQAFFAKKGHLSFLLWLLEILEGNKAGYYATLHSQSGARHLEKSNLRLTHFKVVGRKSRI